jgi:hypothetical protein
MLAFVLAACNNLTGPGANTFPGETIPQGMGLARIRLDTGESVQSIRTARPSDIGAYFALTFTAPGKTPVEKEISGGTSVTVALEPAVWTLEVRGYADSTKADPKATGGTSVPITAGTALSFEVYLTPDFSFGGMGSLSYSISIPATVTRAWFGLYPLDAPGTSQEIDISTSAGGTASNTLIDLPQGSYRAAIDLYDGTNNKAAIWTVVAHIYNGLSTPLNRTFVTADFAECGSLVTAGANTLAAKLDAALALPSGSYTIALDTETDLASFTPKSLSVTGKTITITIRGNGKTVQLGSNGALFTLGTISENLKLVLQDVKLQGRSNNTGSSPLVRVNSGGILEMKTGSRITGNTLSNPLGSSGSPIGGGGVYVASYGTFAMSGGTVNNNISSSSSSHGSGGVYVDGNGTFSMTGGAVSGNSASGFSSSGGGGGVYVAGTFSMTGGAVSGNSASGSSSSRGGGVSVVNGTFTKQQGAIIYGLNESDIALKNTTSGDGDTVYVYVANSTAKNRYTTAGVDITLDTSLSGFAGGWEEPPSRRISDIVYSSVSGSSEWTLQSDGRRQSPPISDNSATKTRVSFASAATNANITIQLDVSSESGYDYAFISTLDNASATYNGGYYSGSRISGTTSITVAIPVSTVGSHFIDIGFQKNNGGNSGSDCAWFKVIE